MTTPTEKLNFHEFIGGLNGALTAQLRKGFAHASIFLDKENFKYKIHANATLESFFCTFEYRQAVVYELQTHIMRVSQLPSRDGSIIDEVCQMLLKCAAKDVKHELARAAVTVSLDLQYFTVGRMVDVPHGYPTMRSTVYAKRVMLSTNRLAGYGALDFQVALGGAAATDDFTVIASYNSLLSDGTKSETLHLPWIGCTWKELESFDLILRSVIDSIVETLSCL